MKINQDYTNAVLVPLSYAGITGGLIGLAAGAGAALLEWKQPGSVGTLAAAGAGLWSWFVFRREHARRLDIMAGVKEQLEQRNAPAKAQTVDLHVMYQEGGGYRGDFLKFTISPETLVQFAKGVTLEGKNLNVHTWSGNSGIMTRGQYDLFKQELIARGYATKVNKHASNSPTELTGKGRALFSYLATGQRPTRETLPHLPKTGGQPQNPEIS